MKQSISVIMKACMRAVLHVFYLFPIRNDRVFFANYCTPRYACNPKYLTEYLYRQYPGRFEYIWMADIPEAFCLERGIRAVRRNSLRFFYYALTSRVFVSNAGMPLYIPFRKGQLTVATWHGGGAYKLTGIDVPRATKRDYREYAAAAKATRLFLSSSRVFTERVIRGAFLYQGEVMDSGLPRNDILFVSPESVTASVRSRYHVPDGTRILLYAPTFRGDFHHASNSGAEAAGLDPVRCIEAAQARFGGDWCMFYRAHHAVSDHLRDAACVDVSDYPDMQELLCAADILITDYSSSMWDFALTGKPGFLFATDIESYENERDFYTPIEEWPYPLATNGEELAKEIRQFDEQRHLAKVTRHLKNLGSYEKGEACRLAGERIAAECLGKREIAE